MYVIRNLNKLDRIPDELREGIFEKLFEVAEIAKFTPEEVEAYEDSLKIYRDLKNSIDTAREEGKIEGIKEKAIEMAKNSLKEGLPTELIVKLTGLTLAEIEKIKMK
jgi:predicted transposase/invertase (TIGR01784 family)